MGMAELKSYVSRFSLRNMRIRNRLVLVYSTLIFLSILIISVLLTTYSRQVIMNKSVNYTVGILEQMGENIDMNLQQIDIASYLIFGNQEVLRLLKYGPNEEYEDRTNIETLLVNVMFTRRDIDSIYLFNNNGRRFGTTYQYSYMPFEQMTKAAAKGDGRMIWIKPGDKKGIIQAVRIIRTMQMEPVGLLTMNIRESSITSIISKQLSDINGSVFVVDGQGKIVSSLSSSEAQSRLTGAVLERIKSEIDTRSTGAGDFRETIDRQDHIVTYYRSQYIDGWQYISVIPARELTKDVTKLLHLSVIGSLFISGLFVLLSFFVSGGIINPIKEMAYRMRRMEIQTEKPDHSYHGEDEIAYLNKSFNGLIQRINTLIREVYEQKLLRSEQELKTLQAQINPHFLYNTLDTVNWMAIARRVPEIGEIVRSLSGIMRYSISNENEEVSIGEELKHVKDYCRIQMFRLSDRLHVVYDVDDEILNVPIPKLVLQPIVENAILHGFRGKEGLCEIIISGYLEEDGACLEISDNGVGMDGKRLEAVLNGEREDDRQHHGVGIHNVDRRLKLKYGSQYGLSITSAVRQGTAVTVRLPA
jgi:two-component system sensor histidine kinase YesM